MDLPSRPLRPLEGAVITAIVPLRSLAHSGYTGYVDDLGYARGELHGDDHSEYSTYSDGASAGDADPAPLEVLHGAVPVSAHHADAQQRGRDRPRSASPSSSDLQATHQRRLNDTPSELSDGATAPACEGCMTQLQRLSDRVRQLEKKS